MYTVDLYLRVRLACHVDGLSQREAASRFGIARETVRKMLRHSEPPGGGPPSPASARPARGSAPRRPWRPTDRPEPRSRSTPGPRIPCPSRLSAPLPCGWRSFYIEAWQFPSPIPNLAPLSRFPRYRRLRRWPRLVGQPVGLIKVYSSRRSCRHVISSVASTGPRLPSPTRSSAEVRVTALQL